jgi:DNA-binding HxlR family transcriptional regulator
MYLRDEADTSTQFYLTKRGDYMPRVKKYESCPLGGMGVGGKGKFWIWYSLLSGSKRFGELQRLLPGSSRQMLTMQLRELEQMGVVHRRVYAQHAPKVEYSLTESARLIEPLLQQIHAWEERYQAETGMAFDWSLSLGGRWRFWIWYHLLNGNKRFCDLQRLLPRASRQMLALQLRALEQMGAVQHVAASKRAPKGEYALTELGRQVGQMLRQMYAWGRWWCDLMGIAFDWPVSDVVARERNVLTCHNTSGNVMDSVGVY